MLTVTQHVHNEGLRVGCRSRNYFWSHQKTPMFNYHKLHFVILESVQYNALYHDRCSAVMRHWIHLAWLMIFNTIDPSDHDPPVIRPRSTWSSGLSAPVHHMWSM